MRNQSRPEGAGHPLVAPDEDPGEVAVAVAPLTVSHGAGQRPGQRLPAAWACAGSRGTGSDYWERPMDEASLDVSS
jgi:hypothetical protein